MAFAETQKLTVQLDLGGNFSSKVGAAARSLQGLDKATSNTQRSLSKLGHNIERGLVIGAGAAVAGFVSVAKAAGDFEAQLNTIGTIVDRKELPQIGEQLRKVARDTGLSLDDLSSAYYDLASAGVKGSLATEALNDAVKLGIGGLATTAETVDLLTTAINAYGLDAKGAAKATDQFALAVADGKVKASEIASTFADVASIAKAYKIGIDQISASYAFLTAQGVPASEVTTEMQRAIVSLVNPTKDLEKAQKKLGISFAKEIATKGLVGALQDLRTYSDKTGIPLNALLGRIEAVKYTLQTTGPNFKGYNAELDKMGKASGTAAAQMAERQQGLNFQINKLKANLKDAAITIGSALLPKLTPLVEKLNTFIGGNQSKIADFGAKLADNFQKLADAVQKIDWQPFIDGLKISGDIAKTVINAFQSLPADLQKLVIAGFALNKVTGGLGTSIAKDIGGALLNNFAQRGSSPANPLFVTDIGGDLGGLAGDTLAFKTGKVIGNLINLSIAGLILSNAVDIGKAVAVALPDWLKGPGGAGKTDAQLARERADAATRTNQIPSDLQGVHAAQAVANVIRELPGKIKDDLTGPANLIKGAAAEFAAATKQLAHPKSQQELVHAAQEMLKLLLHGRGGAEVTAHRIDLLRKQLEHVHDPKTKAALEAKLRKVEGLLPGRQFAAKELAKADKILKSNETNGQKLKDLQAIEKALKDRGLPHAASVIANKVAEAKRAVDYARRAQVEAIKDKDLSVRVNVTNKTTVDINAWSVSAITTRMARFGTASSASAGK